MSLEQKEKELIEMKENYEATLNKLRDRKNQLEDRIKQTQDSN